jgi:hypothetical protein
VDIGNTLLHLLHKFKHGVARDAITVSEDARKELAECIGLGHEPHCVTNDLAFAIEHKLLRLDYIVIGNRCQLIELAFWYDLGRLMINLVRSLALGVDFAFPTAAHKVTLGEVNLTFAFDMDLHFVPSGVVKGIECQCQ